MNSVSLHLKDISMSGCLALEHMCNSVPKSQHKQKTGSFQVAKLNANGENTKQKQKSLLKCELLSLSAGLFQSSWRVTRPLADYAGEANKLGRTELLQQFLKEPKSMFCVQNVSKTKLQCIHTSVRMTMALSSMGTVQSKYQHQTEEN